MMSYLGWVLVQTAIAWWAYRSGWHAGRFQGWNEGFQVGAQRSRMEQQASTPRDTPSETPLQTATVFQIHATRESVRIVMLCGTEEYRLHSSWGDVSTLMDVVKQWEADPELDLPSGTFVSLAHGIKATWESLNAVH